MKRRIITLFLSVALALACAAPALATTGSEADTAAAHLVERGIFKGDESGNLNLDKGLTRAELAALLSRIDGAEQAWSKLSEEAGAFRLELAQYWRENCKFTDVPEWAVLYVSYCHMNGLIYGQGRTLFGATGAVNPQAICTVMLRWLGYAETDWSYDTSIAKAQAVGLLPSGGFSGDSALRGEVAVVIYNALKLSGDDEPEASGIDAYAYAAEIVRYTNLEREKAGVPPLTQSPALTEAAMIKSQDMATYQYVGHESPVFGKTKTIVKLNSWRYMGENVTDGGHLPQHPVTIWMNSKEGHRENLLRAETTHIGIGVAVDERGVFYWTALFGANVEE